MSKSRLFGMAGFLAVSILASIGYTDAKAAEPTASADRPPASARPVHDRQVADLATTNGSVQPVVVSGVARSADALAGSARASSVAARAAKRNAAHGVLPNPGNWVLMVIGVGMIGGALRGFIVANRALARLQPDDLD
jgi:hypothetical protein